MVSAGWIKKDHLGGGLVVLIGAAAIGIGRDYPVGTLNSMGPGFFPIGLGIILVFVGIIIFTVASVAAPVGAKGKTLPPQWRGWACIIGSLIAFAVLGEYGGLVPATIAIVFISALGDRKNSLLHSLILAAAILVACLVVFHWALHVEFPLFTWGG